MILPQSHPPKNMFRISCFPIPYLVFSVSKVDGGQVVAMLTWVKAHSTFQRANVKGSLIVRPFVWWGSSGEVPYIYVHGTTAKSGVYDVFGAFWGSVTWLFKESLVLFPCLQQKCGEQMSQDLTWRSYTINTCKQTDATRRHPCLSGRHGCGPGIYRM